MWLKTGALHTVQYVLGGRFAHADVSGSFFSRVTNFFINNHKR